MKIYWNYEELPQGDGVVMTWIQKFEVEENCKLTTEQMESSINQDTRAQMQAVKEKIEAWQVPS
jgi:aromatase